MANKKTREPKTRDDYCKREEFLFSRQFLQLAIDSDVSDIEWALLSKAVVRYALTGKKEKVDNSIKLIYLEQCRWFDDKFNAWLKVCETNYENGAQGGRPPKSETQSVSENPIGLEKPNGFKKTESGRNNPDRKTDCQTDRKIDRKTEQSDSLDRYLDSGSGLSANAETKPEFMGKVVHHP